jgi:hypothetical protein
VIILGLREKNILPKRGLYVGGRIFVIWPAKKERGGKSFPDLVEVPAPWRYEKILGVYVVRNTNGQALAHVYARATTAEAMQAKTLTRCGCLPLSKAGSRAIFDAIRLASSRHFGHRLPGIAVPS